jgi:hypothetical protein
MSRLFTINILIAGSTPHKSSIPRPVNSVASSSSATSTSASSLSCTVSLAKDFTNVIFIIAVVVEWLGLINWWRSVDGPYSDSIISLGLIPVSLIESSFQTLQGLLHLLHSLLLGMHGLLENLKFGSRRSLPMTSCVIKGLSPMR